MAVVIILFLIFVIMGIIFLFGKGSFLIAGFWYGSGYWRMWLYKYGDICSTGGLAGHHYVGNIRFYCNEYLLQKEIVRHNGEIHVTDRICK